MSSATARPPCIPGLNASMRAAARQDRRRAGRMAWTGRAPRSPVCRSRQGVEQGDLRALQLKGRGRLQPRRSGRPCRRRRRRPSRPPVRRVQPPRASPGRVRRVEELGSRLAVAEQRRPRGRGPTAPMSAPRAYVTVQLFGAYFRTPSSTVVVRSRGCPSGIQLICPEAPAQSPSCACGSSAFGPTTAMVRVGVVAARPARRADRRQGQRAVVAEQHEGPARHLQFSAACSAQPMTAACRSRSGDRGSSNRPSSNLSVSIRRTASSMPASSSRPAGHRLLGGREELRGGHDQVVAGADSDRGRLDVVGADLLLPDHPADVVPVGDEGAGEAPLAS